MNTLQSIAFHQIFICVNNTDTLLCMSKTKGNNCTTEFRDIMLYKPGLHNKNNTLMRFAAVYFSYFFYDDNIAHN